MFMIFKFEPTTIRQIFFCFNDHGKLVVKLDFSKHECLFSRDAGEFAPMLIDFLRLGDLYLKEFHVEVHLISIVVKFLW